MNGEPLLLKIGIIKDREENLSDLDLSVPPFLRDVDTLNSVSTTKLL